MYFHFSGSYASCGFQVRVQRKQMQFVVQVYLPSFMFVVTSWVSFLIKPEVVPGRMALLVTLFLVLINIFNSVRLDEDNRQITITFHIIHHVSTGSRLQYPRD